MIGVRKGQGRLGSSSAAGMAVCLTAACWVSACAAHRAPAVTNTTNAESGAAAPTTEAAPAPKESLSTFIEKVRALTRETQPVPRAGGQSAESWSPTLAAALVAVSVEPSAEAHRRVAAEYRRIGILDMA